MRKTIKSKLSFLLAILFLCQSFLSMGAFATQQSNLDVLFPAHMRMQTFFAGEFTEPVLASLKEVPSATALSTLNVLRGSNGDLMLDRTANRMEGATMLVRLLGAEQEALKENYSHPFTDVATWASPYVGYLYQKGLTNGIGNNLYGSQLSINEKSYLTFLLRSLGYSDKDGEDFTWNTVEQMAIDKGLLKAGEKPADEKDFMRARLSELSWRAMFIYHKIENLPLLVFLCNQGMISPDHVEVLLEGENQPMVNQWLTFLPQMEEAFSKHQEKIVLSLNKEMADSDLQKYLGILLEWTQMNTGVFFKGWSTELWQEGQKYTLTLVPRYANTLQEDKTLFFWIDDILGQIIRPEMSAYEKEKRIHDFLILNLQYDTTPVISDIPESSFHAYGALKTNKAVCNGYAELMLLLCNKAGIPCRIVTGTADGQDHAWNIVYLEGETYLVDVTWDDPVTKMNEDILRYDYFNITDEQMRKDHIWIEENYPAATATALNYYVKNNMVLKSPSELRTALKAAMLEKVPDCTFKLENFSVTDSEIQKMMNDINEEAGYPISSYLFSYNTESQVIRFDSFVYVE